MTLAMKIQEREEIAVLVDRISAIKKGRGQGADDLIMNMFNMNDEQFNEILSLLDKYPDKDEWELAEMILYK